VGGVSSRLGGQHQPSTIGRFIVEGLLVLCVIVWAVGYCIYRAGKRTGSRKGYNVGRDHARRRRR